MGPRAGLDRRKISPHRDSIPGPSSPYSSVAIPTELYPAHILIYVIYNNLVYVCAFVGTNNNFDEPTSSMKCGEFIASPCDPLALSSRPVSENMFC